MLHGTFGFGRKRLESEGTTDEPQRTHLLFSRIYACRIGGVLQRATSQRLQESRDSVGQNPGKSPSPGGIERDDRYRSERRWTFCVPFGRHASLPPRSEERRVGKELR